MENETEFEIEFTDVERALILSLKEKGIYDPETKALFLAWTLKQEELVDRSSDYLTAQIYLNIKRARLYYEAGYSDEALEDFWDARTQALNQENHDLYQEIVQEMQQKFG